MVGEFWLRSVQPARAGFLVPVFYFTAEAAAFSASAAGTATTISEKICVRGGGSGGG